MSDHTPDLRAFGIHDPSSPCAHCGGSHPLVEHYGTDACPVLARKAVAVDAEIDAMGEWHARFDALNAEIDALRDLRALVLRTAEAGPWGADGAASLGRWLEIVNAARGAMTAATFDPSRPA